MSKNRFIYICILVITVFIYIFTNTYYTLFMLILVIMLPLISLTLMLLSGKNVRVEMNLTPIMEKDYAHFSLTLTNAGLIPIARLIIQASIENQLMGATTNKNIYVSLGSKRFLNVNLAIENAKIGALKIHMQKPYIYDIFGLFRIKLHDIPEENTVVYPKMLDLEIYMDKPVETSGDGHRYSPDKKGMDISELFALRDYVEGDDIRKIHWKLSGKVDKIIVRDSSLPLNYSVFLLIELSKSEEAIVDAMLELYLSLSRVLLAEGINHNLAWYDSGSEKLHVCELNTFEDLEVAMAELLTSYAYGEESPALDHYVQSGFRNDQAILIYMTSRPDGEKIAEIQLSQKMRTIYITENQDISGLDSINIFSVDPKHIDEGLPEFII